MVVESEYKMANRNGRFPNRIIRFMFNDKTQHIYYNYEVKYKVTCKTRYYMNRK